MSLNAKEIHKKYEINLGEAKKTLFSVEKNKSVLFGISGKMGSGKDTIGNRISNSSNFKKYSIVQTSYASSIRREISEIVSEYKQGVSFEEISFLYNVEIKEANKLIDLLGESSIFERTSNSRLAIQYWGTDVRRKKNKNYWVNKTVQHIVETINSGKSVYVTDARFPNEVKAIEDLGGKVIRLDVPENVRIDRIIYRDGIKPTQEQLNHKTETALDDYKFKFILDGCDDPDLLAKKGSEYILR